MFRDISSSSSFFLSLLHNLHFSDIVKSSLHHSGSRERRRFSKRIRNNRNFFFFRLIAYDFEIVSHLVIHRWVFSIQSDETIFLFFFFTGTARFPHDFTSQFITNRQSIPHSDRGGKKASSFNNHLYFFPFIFACYLSFS